MSGREASKPTISLVFKRRLLGHRACGVPTCLHPRARITRTPHDRALPMNRSCWDTGAVKLAARVDELTELGLCDPPARCPDGKWHKDGSQRCRLTLYHKGPHEYEAVAA